MYVACMYLYGIEESLEPDLILLSEAPHHLQLGLGRDVRQLFRELGGKASARVRLLHRNLKGRKEGRKEERKK